MSGIASSTIEPTTAAKSSHYRSFGRFRTHKQPIKDGAVGRVELTDLELVDPRLVLQYLCELLAGVAPRFLDETTQSGCENEERHGHLDQSMDGVGT